MDKLAIAKPKRGPLRAGRHLVITENRAHVRDRVLKNSGSGEFIEILTIECKLKRTEYGVGVWSHFTFKQDFDGQRDERRRCDGGRVGGGWSVGNGR